MNTIAPAIKRRRVQLGLTQREVAERVHLSEKAWQNIENGVTRMDLDRLQQIAEVLEISMMDLINSQEALTQNNSFDNHSIGNNVNYANEVNLQPNSDSEKELLHKVIADKDEQIRLLRAEVDGLKEKVDAFIEQLLKD